jgi:hypothetical protein
MQADVIDHGPTVLEDMFGKDGAVIGKRLKGHPVLGPLTDMVAKLGLNLAAMRMTPQEIQKTKAVEDAGKSIADAFGNAVTALAAATRKVDDDDGN